MGPPTTSCLIVWFDGWEPLLRIVTLGTLGYVALVALLRVSGKRTLSKMNAFDFVITITLGSAYASLLVTESMTLAEGVTALGLLITLQWVVSWIYVRSPRFEAVIKGKPQLLFWLGQYLEKPMKRERITREEIQAAMREANATVEGTTAAVIESDGTVTLVAIDDLQLDHAMGSVRRD